MNKVIKPILAISFIIATAIVIQSWLPATRAKRDFYQLTVYHYSNSEQEKMLDTYFQTALLPALHRMDLKNVGVFKDRSNDTIAGKKFYVLVPFEWMDILNIPGRLNTDKDYQAAGAGYLNAAYSSPS